MPSFLEARRIILANVPLLGVERVPLLAAAGRVLAENVHAPWDMPSGDNSAMDGFAVRAEDSRAGAVLQVTGYTPAGDAPASPVPPGGAVRIMTGAPLPPGAAAVVPIEDTEAVDGTVRLLREVVTGQHIRRRGEDIAAGACVIPAATLIRPAEISMLASLGMAMVPVRRRPRVAILSTGDELVELGQPPAAGQTINSNSFALAAAVRACGGEPLLLGIARDNREEHRRLLAEGLGCDALITSAGVSAGDRDLVREVLAELGARQLFWKVDIRPGSPMAFAVRGTTPVFSLPGNPVATLLTCEMFVAPALRQMQGHAGVIRPTVPARLQEAVKKKPGRVQFLRVQVRREGTGLAASSSGDQNTGILRTMVRANGIAILPFDRERFAAGEEVEVHLLDPLGLL